MWVYLARRLLLMIPTLLGVTLVVFAVMASSPGGISAQSLVEGQNLEPQAKKALEDYYNRLYGLDQPAALQYLRWLNSVSPVGFDIDENGELGDFNWLKPSDLGRSFRYGRAVDDLVLERLPATLLLNVLSLPLIYVLAIGIGVNAAAHAGSRFDRFSGTTMLVFWSVPTMLAGILLIGFFANEQYWHWFPTAGLSERVALDMRFMPHWSSVGDAVLAVSIVIASVVAGYLALALRSPTLRMAMTSIAGLVLGGLMIGSSNTAPGILAAGLILLVVALPVAMLALISSDVLRHAAGVALGLFAGLIAVLALAQPEFERGFLLDRLWHLVLPVVCLSYGGLAFLMRLTRSTVLENLSADYARTARAKSVHESDVLWGHVFRNSLLPLITVSASLLPGLLAGSVIVESIFSIDGMGKLAIEADHNQRQTDSNRHDSSPGKRQVQHRGQKRYEAQQNNVGRCE